MSDAAATLLNPLTDAADAAPVGSEAGLRRVLERQLAVLGRLAEAGLNIALNVERRALAGEAADAGSEEAESDAAPARPGRGGDVALAYARVSRAVRLTIALQGRVVQELQALDDEAVRQRLREESAAARARQAAAAERKARVERILERVIDAEARDESEGERLADEAFERLEGDDIYGELAGRPVSEVIARVCEDLGLAPDWARLSQEAWARDELASGDAGAPLIAYRWLDGPLENDAAEPGGTEPDAPEPDGPARPCAASP